MTSITCSLVMPSRRLKSTVSSTTSDNSWCVNPAMALNSASELMFVAILNPEVTESSDTADTPVRNTMAIGAEGGVFPEKLFMQA